MWGCTLPVNYIIEGDAVVDCQYITFAHKDGRDSLPKWGVRDSEDRASPVGFAVSDLGHATASWAYLFRLISSD